MTTNTKLDDKTRSQQKQALLKIRELKAQVAKLQQEKHAPIAVIGMGCRFPGNVNNPDEYWNVLKHGVDCIKEIPPERWDVNAYYHLDPAAPGKMYVREGGFLQQVDQFDPDFFGIPQREANSMDPQQRLLLEVCWEALEDANIQPLQLVGSQTGVFVGICTQDYARYSLNSHNHDNIDVYSFTGNAGSIAGGRISKTLGLQGPNITIDTACSSSLVAAHLAVQSLRAGESKLALVGGVNVILSPENFIYFCKVKALSPDARCKTFDETANGYVRAEGCGFVVLKRLDEALQDGDRIHAVICGSAINQDGISYGLTAPNGTAQRELIKKALADASVEPTDITYVEAHGTGTPLGDPIEISALGEVYGKGRTRDRALLIGAVKSNIGHTEAASGMAGLIKAVLCLKHRAIPGNLHFQHPNKQIPWDQLPVSIPTKLQPWPDYQQRKMAGVSAFGFSGTNAHLILEQAPITANHQAKNLLQPSVFNRKRCWLKPIAQRNHIEPYKRIDAVHPLLGNRLLSPLLDQICFEALIDLNELSYLRSHPVWGRVVMPGSGYVEMAAAVAKQLYNKTVIQLEDLVYQEAFVIREDRHERLQMVLSDTSDNLKEFQILSLDKVDQNGNAIWHHHASGRLRLDVQSQPDEKLAKNSILARCQRHFNRETFYSHLADHGYQYGKEHQGVENAWLGEGEIIAQIAYAQSLDHQPNANGTAQAYCFHPAFLDSAFQLLLMLLPSVEADQMYVTLGKERVIIYAQSQPRLWVHTRRKLDINDDQATVKGDVRIYDDQGELIAETIGYVMKRTAKTRPHDVSSSQPNINLDTCYQTIWQPWPPSAQPAIFNHQGVNLVFADQQGYADGLCAEMAKQGIAYVRINLGEDFQCLDQKTYTAKIASATDINNLFNAIQQHGTNLTPELSNIIYCRSIDDCLLEDIEPVPTGIIPLTALIQSLQNSAAPISARLTVLTKNAQKITDQTTKIEPLQATYWGLANVVHEELPNLGFRCIDIDFNQQKKSEYTILLREISVDSSEQLVALRGQQRFVRRLSQAKLTAVPQQKQFLKLGIGQRGDLSSLQWLPQPRRQLKAHEVEIRVHASGLNLRDVVDGLGLHPRQLEEFGLECAGIVSAVGESVSSVKRGDPVIAFGTGSFGQYLITDENRVSRKPEHLSFEESAAISIAFLTAYYSLQEIGKMKAGERVLIHAAAGGVGIAAVQLALLQGAEVYATASKHKWPFLRSLGVKHMMNSRSLDFADQILALTGGQGVHMVINSLADDFIAKSVDVVKPNGRFVEIGLKGWTTEKMKQHRPDIKYHIVNLMAKWESDAKAVKSMLNKLIDLFHPDSGLQPLPCIEFESQNIVQAFRYMQQGKHIGKIIVTQNVDDALDTAYPGTQIITGGLGAIALQLLSYLVSQGCTSLALISRRKPDAAAKQILHQLKSQGATIKTFQADVANPTEMANTLTKIRQQMLPIKGIYHAAGITDDGLLTELNTERFYQVFRPKIQGAYNLHRLTLADDVQQFVLFSSMTSMLGFIGVANYAAANAFLDAFAHYRITHGRPATSIAWGPWSEAGMFTALDANLRHQLTQRGLRPLNNQQNLEYFARILQQPSGQYGAFAIDWQLWLRHGIANPDNPLFDQVRWQYQESKPCHKNHLGTVAIPTPQYKSPLMGGKSSPLLEQLQFASGKWRQTLLTSFLQKQVAAVLTVDDPDLVDIEAGFFDLGMDSLTSVELRNSIQSQLGFALSATVTFDHPNIIALAEFLLAQLPQNTSKPQTSQTKSDITLADDINNVLTDIGAMSDDEILAALME